MRDNIWYLPYLPVILQGLSDLAVLLDPIKKVKVQIIRGEDNIVASLQVA